MGKNVLQIIYIYIYIYIFCIYIYIFFDNNIKTNFNKCKGLFCGDGGSIVNSMLKLGGNALFYNNIT